MKSFGDVVNEQGVLTMSDLHIGYVRMSTGTILVQIPSDNPWGFALASDDMAWPGGFGAPGSDWEPLPDNDPQITDEVRERLGWILEDAMTMADDYA